MENSGKTMENAGENGEKWILSLRNMIFWLWIIDMWHIWEICGYHQQDTLKMCSPTQKDQLFLANDGRPLCRCWRPSASWSQEMLRSTWKTAPRPSPVRMKCNASLQWLPQWYHWCSHREQICRGAIQFLTNHTDMAAAWCALDAPFWSLLVVIYVIYI